MGRVRARIDADGRLIEAERLWYDTSRWASFVDGFGHLREADPRWPEAGDVLWDSKPGGRGRVLERVTGHRAGDGQDLEIDDERMTGTQTVRFAGVGDERVRVVLELRWRLKRTDVFAPVVDLFVRRAMRESLNRTLQRFAIELASDREHAT